MAPLSSTPPAATASAHVLVVEDVAEIREFLREVIEMSGHRASAVPSADEALEACRQDPPQVVLTDLHTSPVSGEELIRALRAEMPSVVPIVVTGHGTIERTVELMRLGAFDVLTKPCRADEISATVDKALEHQRALSSNHDLRQQLRVQEKLAMIGKLAAGVAHELNNPLDATLRCVRLTQERVQGDDEATEYLDLAHAGLLRMADIVQSLLTFSRNAAVEQAPQPLAALVEECVASVRLALGSDAPELSTDVAPAVAHAAVPRGIHQVLTNLLRNACDAASSDTTVRVVALRDGDDIHLAVCDDGPGMDDDVLDRVFEPFFTTKEPGKGTGLGLPISARLVEKFGGSIRIECPAGGGTTVTATLPAVRYLSEAI